jgi:sigma-B regulation protein RsbU (phosphoserine phosphatase)
LVEAPSAEEPAALVRRIVDAVSAHAASFHATDDLTVLAVTFAPSGVTARRRAAGEQWLLQPEISAAGIREARQRLRAILTARSVAVRRIDDAELITEELLTNVVRAASAGAETWMSLELELTGAEILLTVRDNGLGFDPLALATPNLDADIAERDVGGLGIHLVRELADDCRYARVGDLNVLTIHLNRTIT